MNDYEKWYAMIMGTPRKSKPENPMIVGADRPATTLRKRCEWFGEGRGQCLFNAGHRGHHTCEEDGRLLQLARDAGGAGPHK